MSGRIYMRLVKLLVIILMITALGAASYFIISAKNKAHAYDLVQISTARPISFGEDQDIHFFSEGFIITGPQARFYNYSGNEMSKPFTHDDLLYENGEINIALHTENYLITKSGHIYSTASVPFKRIYDNPEGLVIAGAQEGADFLLLLLARDEYNVEPYILVNGSTFLLSLTAGAIRSMPHLRYQRAQKAFQSSPIVWIHRCQRPGCSSIGTGTSCTASLLKMTNCCTIYTGRRTL